MPDLTPAAPTPAANIANAITAKTNPVPAGKDAPAPAVAADPNAGKEKYVVDGKEIYLSPDQAKAYVQKGLAFEPQISHLGRLQQETAAFLDTLSKDPGKVIYNERFGSPEEVLSKILNSTKVSDKVKDTIGQWYYNNVIAPEKLSPQERELAEYKRKTEEYEERERKQRHDELAAEDNRRVQAALSEIKARINEAMSEAGVPMESPLAPQLAKRVAQIMQLGFVNGKTVTPKEAMAKAKSELLAYQKAYYDVLDEDKLVDQLGKENAEKVRKYYLKQVKAAEKGEKPVGSTRPAKRDERKTMTPDQFKDYLDGLKKGK